jgi:hypothetical protein
MTVPRCTELLQSNRKLQRVWSEAKGSGARPPSRDPRASSWFRVGNSPAAVKNRAWNCCCSHPLRLRMKITVGILNESPQNLTAVGYNLCFGQRGALTMPKGVYMSGIQYKQEPVSSDKGEIRRSLSGSVMGKSSTGARLIELGIALAGAESSASMPGSCSHCRSHLNAQRSTAQYPHVFCSEQCERKFICAALASLTLKECIRIHNRLGNLLIQEPAV